MALARVAARQQGVVTLAQLLDAGLSERAIRSRTAEGWLTRRHKGVYRFGVFGGPHADEVAALLACGPGTVLSHQTAAALWGLTDRPRTVHVSTPTGSGRRHAGVHVHRQEPGSTRHHGLPITTPARTLLDLSPSMPERALDHLTEQAQVQRLVTRAQLLKAVEEGAGRPGVKKLRAIVGSADEPAFTRSQAERELVELVRAADLPRPRTNVRVAGLEVDAVWDRQRLIVEVDGWTYHHTRAAFERDRRRDAHLLVAGYRVLRITWRRLTREREAVIALLAAAL